MDFSKKIWHDTFQLSQAVFRVTHLFPENEILKRHLREKITELLYQASFNPGAQNHKNLMQEFHGFRSLLFSAKNCNFVDEKNLVILTRECETIIENLGSKDAGKNEEKSPEIKESFAVAMDESGPVFDQNFTSKYPRKNIVATNNKTIKNPQKDSSMIGFFMPSSRQQRIVDFFQKIPNEKLGLKEVVNGFKDIPSRTIRHDLKDLCDQGFLGRIGRGPGSAYFLIKNKA